MKFLGASDDDEKLVILGVPYEGELVFRKGAKFAPERIRYFSDSIEEYSIYSKDYIPPFNDLGDLELGNISSEEMVNIVKNRVLTLIKSGKKVILLGGDHTISLGTIMANKLVYPNLVVLHFDAHLDRRDDYLGNTLNYATVMKRVEEIVGRENVYSFGIRSVAKEEEPFVNPRIFEFDVLEPLKRIWEMFAKRPLYMSFDFDIIDPSFFPAVTNPEPCGINIKEALEVIKMVAPYTVGADFVEYNPSLDPSGSAGVTASIIIREFLINSKK